MANNDAFNYVNDQELAARLATSLDEENGGGGGWGLPLTLGGVGGGILGVLATLAGKRFFRWRQARKDKRAVEALARSIRTLTGLNTDTSGKTAGEYVRTLNPERLEAVANRRVEKLAEERAVSAQRLKEARIANRKIRERADADRSRYAGAHARYASERLDARRTIENLEQARDRAINESLNNFNRAENLASRLQQAEQRYAQAPQADALLEQNRLYEGQLTNAKNYLREFFTRKQLNTLPPEAAANHRENARIVEEMVQAVMRGDLGRRNPFRRNQP